jgi:hypothetical protein
MNHKKTWQGVRDIKKFENLGLSKNTLPEKMFFFTDI